MKDYFHKNGASGPAGNCGRNCRGVQCKTGCLCRIQSASYRYQYRSIGKAGKGSTAEKVAITCSVTPYNLVFCDEDVTTYDSNLKVNPPLRNKKTAKRCKKLLQKEASIVLHLIIFLTTKIIKWWNLNMLKMV